MAEETRQAEQEGCNHGDSAEEGDFIHHAQTLMGLHALGTGKHIQRADDLLQVKAFSPGRGIVAAGIGKENTTGDGSGFFLDRLVGVSDLAGAVGFDGEAFDVGGVFDEFDLQLANLIDGNNGTVAQSDVMTELDVNLVGRDVGLRHGHCEGEGGDEIVIPAQDFGPGLFDALLHSEGELDVGRRGGGGREEDAIDSDESSDFAGHVGEWDSARLQVGGDRLALGGAVAFWFEVNGFDLASMMDEDFTVSGFAIQTVVHAKLELFMFMGLGGLVFVATLLISFLSSLRLKGISVANVLR